MLPQLRILVCDDSQSHRQLAERALRQALSAEYELACEGCGDGLAALERVKQGGLDLVLLDYRMPGADGLEVLRERQRQNIQVPVIFVTVETDRMTVVEAMKLGASDFIGKDEFTAARLPQVVRSTLERARLRDVMIRSEKLAAIGTLAGGVAHEFNNVLQIVLGHTQYALTRDDPERWKHALVQAKEAAEKGAAIVKQLLSFARTRRSSQIKFRLEQAVRDAISQDGALAKRDGVVVEFIIKAQPMVLGDSEQIAQLILNLLTNARHACKMLQQRKPQLRPRVEVGLDADDQFAKVTVRDNGVGMDPAVMKRLYEPFFTTKGALGGTVFDGKAHGTGLGLAIAQRIVAEHDGRIDVASVPEDGTTFTVSLPLAFAGAVASDLAAALEAPTRELAGKSILILEDEPLIAGLISNYLADCGMACDVAGNMRQAVALANEKPYSIMLFDMMIDGKSAGLEAMREIRRGGGPNAKGKALVMTGHAVTEKDGALLDAGFLRVVHKPFSMRDVFTVLVEALRA